MKLLRQPDLTARGFGCRSLIYDKVRRGTFPKPAKYGHWNVWTEAQIDEYVRGLLQEQAA